MFTHDQVWHGIDRLARERGLRRVRTRPARGPRPDHLQSQQTGDQAEQTALAEHGELGQNPERDRDLLGRFRCAHGRSPAEWRAIDLAPPALHRRGSGGRRELFDEFGFPTGQAWDEIDFPNLDDPHAYALEVRGDDFLPTYRDGDLLIVSPVAGIRRRDRVMLRSKAGAIHAGTLLRRTAQRIEIAPFAEGVEPQVVSVKDVAWLVRIVWVSQ